MIRHRVIEGSGHGGLLMRRQRTLGAAPRRHLVVVAMLRIVEQVTTPVIDAKYSQQEGTP